MKMYEYMGKSWFQHFGIPIPKGKVGKTPQEVAAASSEIGDSVIKSQILSGKRGKAGGIKFTAEPVEAQKFAEEILGKELIGMVVDALLVEEKLKIDKEYYLAITIDRSTKSPVILASIKGGMDIEDVPAEYMVAYHMDYAIGMMPFVAREVAREMGIPASEGIQLQDILKKLYKMFVELDAELVEINPLVVSDGKLIAADAKVTIDDDALFRQKEITYVEERSESEKKAHELGLSYVDLDGDIGVMANGAGITMATLDAIQYHGGSPSNFMDAGGGASEEATGKALELILDKDPKVILINIFGGITRCDDVANAFVSVKKKMGIKVPVVIRLAGTNQEEGRKILSEEGIETFETMDEAAQKAVQLALY